jgi:Family of unknown function (DUF6152)
MKSHTFHFLSLAAVLTVAPAFAHHSFAAEYDVNRPITLKGTLTKLEWTNPHGWIYIAVKGDDGSVANWAVEFGAPNTLLRRGLRKTDFPVGVELVVKGYRAKDSSPTINGTTVKLPDGRDLFTGSSDPTSAGADK